MGERGGPLREIAALAHIKQVVGVLSSEDMQKVKAYYASWRSMEPRMRRMLRGNATARTIANTLRQLGV